MGNKMKRFLSTVLVLALLSTNSLTALASQPADSNAKANEELVINDTENIAAKNTITGETYENITDALNAASSEEIISLEKDASVTMLAVKDDVTLDLNGHTLEASYVTCFGNIVDQSAENEGLLKVDAKRFLIQDKNKQLPIKSKEGYKFFELSKFDARYLEETAKYAFVPYIESAAHELITVGADVSGVTVNVRVSWTQNDGLRTQDFVYTDSMAEKFFNSYVNETGKYGQMFTLVLNGTTAFEELTFSAVLVSDTGVEIASEPIKVETKDDTQNPDDTEKPDDTENPGSTGSSDVTTDEDNKVTGDVKIEAGQASANVSTGTQLDENTNELKLTVKEMDVSNNEIEVADKEEIHSVNVHVDGVAENNTVPIIITVDEFAPEFLNQGNIKLYHVENDKPVEMTRVYSMDELNEHNEYYYDPATGIVTMAMATFSEVAVVSDTENGWNGIFDYDLAGEGTEENPYIIATADELAGFGAIVGGMNGQTKNNYDDKFIKLISDINLGDAEAKNDPDKIFYPIGYYNSTGKYDRTSDSVTSNVSSFSGTFDGNGHTIKNFYQNTWEMFGDYVDGYGAGANYYKDAMGLFGYVNGGTVKNLTVDHFSSDGEFTPTGVIAAYAANSTFENIAITNCNPRVYNTGNGGIVGIGGNSDDTEDLKLTFTNITIDNTNKITALWGSWDVACGGLVGMFRGAGHAYMTNCHVAAQIDVYNDVCGNYQYYWYRYSGMMIGTNKNMVTDDQGYTVPETTKFHAEECTVHFGDWNNYYYCELVDNSLASYTHDHQFSRLEEVKEVNGTTITYLDGTTGAVPTSGRANYVVVNGKASTENATCYHYLNGQVWSHEQGGYEEKDINGDGVVDSDVLKENNQHIYLPFNQLFTGYGWGVKHIPVYNGEDYAFEGITILDREVADSVVKFEKADTAKDSYTTGTTVTIGDLFKAIEENTEVTIDADNVSVTVSPIGEESTVTGTYVPAEIDENGMVDWTKGTLTFEGKGTAEVIITDYYYCKPTTLKVNIVPPAAIDAFEIKLPNYESYLYRIGNDNAVSISSLFELIEGVSEEKIGTVNVEVKDSNKNIRATYAAGTTWDSGTITISDDYTGLVYVTISSDGNVNPLTLPLEVVDALNVTSATSASNNNVVLLNDVSSASNITIEKGCAFYGNGFTLNYTGNGSYNSKSLQLGFVTVKTGGILENTRVVCKIFPEAYIYTSQMTASQGPYAYQFSAITVNDARVENCYIYGARNNIFINGDATIKNTITECGSLANIQIDKCSNENTITLENVTTIQSQKTDDFGVGNTIMGFGVVVGTNESTTNPKIILNNDFIQYNWVSATDADAISNEYAKAAIDGALGVEKYCHDIDGITKVNMGIAYLNEKGVSVENHTGLPYEEGKLSMTIQNIPITGDVYSLVDTPSIYSDVTNADRSTSNGYYEPQMNFTENLGGQLIEETTDCDEFCYEKEGTIKVMFVAGETKTLDLSGLVSIKKYTGQDLGLTIACEDSDGNQVDVAENKITLSEQKEYLVTYSVKDKIFYDKDGETLEKIIEYAWEVPITVSLKDKSLPNAEFEITNHAIYCSGYSGNYSQFMPFLAGVKIYDYTSAEEKYTRFNGDDDYNKIVSATIENVNTSGEAQGNHIITVELTDGGKIIVDLDVRATSGGSTHSGSIKVRNNILYVVNGGTTSAKGQLWKVYNYKFVGNNGVEINSGAFTFGTEGTDASTATKPTSNFTATINATVIFDVNGGNCYQTKAYATSNSTSVTLPTPTRSGYYFDGWYTSVTGGELIGKAGATYTPTADITLYAQWGKGTITYDANGGVCDKDKDEYTGTPIVLPSASRDGKVFSGWFTAKSGGEKIGMAGFNYIPVGDITLYAQWQDPATVTYDANGGTCNVPSATFEKDPLTLPTPTRDGYRCIGWYTSETGGEKIGDVGGSYTPEADITLYAQWVKEYTITYTINDNVESYSGATKACAGEKIDFIVTYKSNCEYDSVTVTGETSNTKVEVVSDDNKTFSFEMPAENVNVSIKGKSCVTADTLITLEDGSQVRVDSLTGEEELLVWNMLTGAFDSAPIMFVDSEEETEYNIIHLYFSDGTDVKVIYEHGFWDYDLNKYVYLDANASKYIGHTFAKQSGDKLEKVELVDVVLETEYTSAWSPVTVDHLCYFVNGMLSMPGGVGGLFNIFDVDPDTMSYDMKAMEQDIETYGLFTYEELNNIEPLSEEMFKAAGGAYLKISIGKGNMTMNDLIYMIRRYSAFFK